MTDWYHVKDNDKYALVDAVFEQPTSVGIDATREFSFYDSGIFECKTRRRWQNHAVLAVGYNLVDGYWIIKNSWGEGWGENGFIRIIFGNDKQTCSLYDDSNQVFVA